jgi:ribosomal protein L37E
MSRRTWEDRTEWRRVFVCGTRAVVEPVGKPLNAWRVVCATCGGGGTVKHRTYNEATHAAVRDSAKRCRTCGAH